MIDGTPTNLKTSADRAPSQPASRQHSDYMGPASRFEDELDAIVRAALDEGNLQQLLLDCILRYRNLVGVGWYIEAGSSVAPLAVRFDNPALQHQPLQDWIASSCHSVIESQRDAVLKSSDVRNLALIALPIRNRETPRQVLVLLVANPDDALIEKETLAGRSAVRAVVDWNRQRELVVRNEQLRTTAALLELTGRLEAARDLTEASRILADSLADHLHADLVAVGLCRRSRVTTQLTAIGGVADVDHNSDRARMIKSVIDEAIVRGSCTVLNSSDETTQHQTLAHRGLAERMSAETVMSTPLRNDAGDIIGGVMLAGASSLDRRELRGFLETMDVPVAGALEVVRRAQPGLLQGCVRQMLGSKPVSRSVVATVVLLMITLLMFVPMPYRIPCQFSIEPLERRFCVAPYDGLLRETFVEPGDLVTAGQTLATMDDAEMRFELAGLSAELHHAAKQRDVHRAGERIADSFMAALEVDRIHSRTELLQHYLETLNLQSQLDGVVLAGGVERRQNYPVTVGQTLYEIAPLNKVLLEVAVSAREVDHVRIGMAVEFRLDSEPADVRTGSIQRIRPRSEIVRDQNVFIAEVVFPNADQKLRPGMEGTARVVSAAHPLGWNLFHRAYDFVTYTVFW